jgi:hypothetical protein
VTTSRFGLSALAISRPRLMAALLLELVDLVLVLGELPPSTVDWTRYTVRFLATSSSLSPKLYPDSHRRRRSPRRPWRASSHLRGPMPITVTQGWCAARTRRSIGARRCRAGLISAFVRAMVACVSEDTTAGMSEDQLREYVARLRSAPAEQVVSGVLSELLEIARVKLGRRDARLFIDVCAALLEQVRSYVSAEIAGQVDRALGEFRLAQVQAERSPDRQDEPNDLAEAPAARSSSVPSAAQSATSAGSASSKLWIPGRPH